MYTSAHRHRYTSLTKYSSSPCDQHVAMFLWKYVRICRREILGWSTICNVAPRRLHRVNETHTHRASITLSLCPAPVASWVVFILTTPDITGHYWTVFSSYVQLDYEDTIPSCPSVCLSCPRPNLDSLYLSKLHLIPQLISLQGFFIWRPFSFLWLRGLYTGLNVSLLILTKLHRTSLKARNIPHIPICDEAEC
jgi:hypothetical protein